MQVKKWAGLVFLAMPMLAVGGLGAAQDTRLLDAARAADAAGVTALLEQGASANTRQADGATALHWAAHWDNAAMADALVRAGADVDAANDFGASPLWLACRNGSAAMVGALLAAGADANAALPSGETVLMTASRTGSAEAVGLLASHGADLNAREHTRGQTALMWAVAQQHPDVVETLVALGADVHARSAPQPRRIHTRTAGFNPAGVIDTVLGSNTPILFAARHGNLDAARHLVAAGADVNDTAATGTSALVVAAHSGHTALAVFLLDHGADPNAAGAGYTALHAATLRGDETLAAALLARGADPNAPVLRGSQGRRNSPDYVLEHDVVGATAFWLAGHFAEPGVMRALAAGGADPHVVMEDGTTPLMAAVAARRRREPGLAADPAGDERVVLEAARAAIDAGVDVNAAGAAGNTALHTAAGRRLDTVVQFLVDRGADPRVLNDSGQTPLDLARRGGDDNSTAALLRHLATRARQPAAAQDRAGGAGTSSTVADRPWTAPRTPDGQPDLQGVWLNTSATPFERPEALAGRQFLTDDEVAELTRRANRIFKENDADLAIGDALYLAALADVEAFRRRGANRSSNFMVDREFDNRTSQIVDPPDGRLPALLPAAVERLAALTARDLDPAGPEDLNPRARCVTPGMPRIGPGPRGDPLYGYYQIFQSPGYFVLLMETNHDARIVRLDGTPPLSPRIRQWHGDSRGRWDGDTLVIETANFSPRSDFLGAAENLHLVERLTRVGPDAIRYEVTVDDPTTWARPWTAAVRLKRQDANIYEFACHEGNRAIMLSILGIARAHGPRGAAAWEGLRTR